MLEGVEVLYHSSIKISKEKIIYIDPYKIKEEKHDADIIFITHDHFDHYSEEDICKIKKEDTIIIVPRTILSEVNGFDKENIITVEPGKRYTVHCINFETVPAYNINKKFHPKENNWVGYIIEIDGVRYYIAGDTGINEENQKVRCDVAFVPVGGTYTMDYEEAAKLVNTIKPQIAVPVHYGSVVGKEEDAIKFIKLLDENIQGRILKIS